MPDFLCWKHYMLFTSDDVFIEYNSILMYNLNFYQASQVGKAWPVLLGIISGTLFCVCKVFKSQSVCFRYLFCLNRLELSALSQVFTWLRFLHFSCSVSTNFGFRLSGQFFTCIKTWVSESMQCWSVFMPSQWGFLAIKPSGPVAHPKMFPTHSSCKKVNECIELYSQKKSQQFQSMTSDLFQYHNCTCEIKQHCVVVFTA